MHPYIIASLLITSCLGGYFGEIDKGVIKIDCKNEIYNDIGYSATHYEDMNCKVIETDDQDFNRSEKRKQAGTEERKEEDTDSKSELSKKA